MTLPDNVVPLPSAKNVRPASRFAGGETSEVEELRAEVRQLEARLAKLETSLGAPFGTSVDDLLKSGVVGVWKDMSDDEAEAFLKRARQWRKSE